MLKKLKQTDKKDRISRYRYSAKWYEQKYELNIDNKNEWLYNKYTNRTTNIFYTGIIY